MATIPTYILAPNFTYINENDNWLGRLISDPLQPTRILDSGPGSPHDPSTIQSILESSNSYKRLKGHTLDASIWATFFQFASAKLSGSVSKETSVSYSMTGMETRYLKRDPTDDDVAARIQANPRVKAAMNAGLFGRKPVYMITGLKIAKGLELTVSRSTERSGRIGGDAPITPAGEVSAGAEMGASTKSEVVDSSKSEVDVIFAYQLHVIAERGWSSKKKTVEAKSFRPDYAFLGEEKKSKEESFEATVAGKEELDAGEFQEGDAGFESVVVRAEGVEGETASGEVEQCICIVGEE